MVFKTRLESGPVTADLTTTVVHSYKLLINDVKADHSLTIYFTTLISISNNLKDLQICFYRRQCIFLSVMMILLIHP